jgi:hypothetical protein
MNAHPAAPANWMADRRTVLRGTAAIAALAATPIAAAAGTVRFVVIDSRHRQSVMFGREGARFGADILDAADGLTLLWQDQLVPHWREPHGAVIGLTTRSVWDGLSQQALGQFRRPRLLGRHRHGGGAGGLDHALELPAALFDRTGRHLLDPAMWPAAMAVLTRACVDTPGIDRRHCQFRRPGMGADMSNELVSWMIA